MTAETSADRIARYKREANVARAKADKAPNRSIRAALLEAASAWERLAQLEAEIQKHRSN